MTDDVIDLGAKSKPSAALLAATAAMLGGDLGASLPRRRVGRPPVGVCGERERQRHAHRARVDAAAREWQRADGAGEKCVAEESLDAALAAPKPWRKA